jgi:hypothetical protein
LPEDVIGNHVKATISRFQSDSALNPGHTFVTLPRSGSFRSNLRGRT